MSLEVKCVMFNIAKGHQTLLQSENHLKKQTMAFMFFVMLVIGMLPKVR